MTLLRDIASWVMICVGLNMLQNDFHFSDHTWWALWLVIAGVYMFIPGSEK